MLRAPTGATPAVVTVALIAVVTLLVVALVVAVSTVGRCDRDARHREHDTGRALHGHRLDLEDRGRAVRQGPFEVSLATGDLERQGDSGRDGGAVDDAGHPQHGIRCVERTRGVGDARDVELHLAAVLGLDLHAAARQHDVRRIGRPDERALEPLLASMARALVRARHAGRCQKRHADHHHRQCPHH